MFTCLTTGISVIGYDAQRCILCSLQSICTDKHGGINILMFMIFSNFISSSSQLSWRVRFICLIHFVSVTFASFSSVWITLSHSDYLWNSSISSTKMSIVMILYQIFFQYGYTVQP